MPVPASHCPPGRSWRAPSRSKPASLAVVLAGLNTALSLAEMGRDVCLLEGRQIGWGASGRNGGFVGAGGYARDLASLVRAFGVEDLLQKERRAAGKAVSAQIGELPHNRFAELVLVAAWDRGD